MLGDAVENGSTCRRTKIATGHLLGAAGAIEAISLFLPIAIQVATAQPSISHPAVETQD